MRLGVVLIFLGLLPLPAQNNQLAGLQQDLAELRTEVEKLKLENADLRDALAKQKAGQGQSASQAEAIAKSRTETLAELDRRLKQQTAEVNAALAELTRQVNAALGKTAAPAAVKSASGAATKTPAAKADAAPADDGFPADMPRTGIKYRVKPGDTVTGIARRNGSKPDWIMTANKMASPGALRADVEIFIPQAEAAR
jgi:septal ring factor EnvC (AmiA/AmiB activator)